MDKPCLPSQPPPPDRIKADQPGYVQCHRQIKLSIKLHFRPNAVPIFNHVQAVFIVVGFNPLGAV